MMNFGTGLFVLLRGIGNKCLHLVGRLRDSGQKWKILVTASLVWTQVGIARVAVAVEPPVGQKVAAAQAEQERLLKAVLIDISRVPIPTLPSAADTKKTKALRVRYAFMIREFERIQATANQLSEAKTLYLVPQPQDTTLLAYRNRLRDRLKAEGNLDLPKDGEAGIHGLVMIYLVIAKNGSIDDFDIVSATSERLKEHVISVVARLRPFEPIPEEFAQSVDRFAVAFPFLYTQQ